MVFLGTPCISTDYTMRDIQIETIGKQKDLGILISSNLKPKPVNTA